MTKRITAKLLIKNNRGSEPDVHELLELISSQVKTDELLCSRDREALDALYAVDQVLEEMGWNEF